MFLVSLRGRIRRPIFVVLYLATTAMLYGLLLLAIVVALGPCPASAPTVPTRELIVIGLLAAVLLVLRTSIEVRRLHDMSRSGWWALGMLIGTMSLPVLDAYLDVRIQPDANKLSLLLFYVVLVAYFLLLALARGAPGQNRYGPPPNSAWSLRTPPR